MTKNILAQDIIIDSLSARSLYLEQSCNGIVYGRATGFIVSNNNKKYLITNWHVVTGINPITGDTLDSNSNIPNQLLIYYHTSKLGFWRPDVVELYTLDGKKNWLEHPNGSKVDVIALPITPSYSDLILYELDLNLAKVDMIPEVAMPVSIIGFPEGFVGRKQFPIWKTGHLASEPSINYNNQPIILIDATTRKGMSGSPVILRLKDNYKMKSGNKMMASTSYRTLFLGIYSAQSPLAEIGIIWKPIVLEDIFNNN